MRIEDIIKIAKNSNADHFFIAVCVFLFFDSYLIYFFEQNLYIAVRGNYFENENGEISNKKLILTIAPFLFFLGIFYYTLVPWIYSIFLGWAVFIKKRLGINRDEENFKHILQRTSESSVKDVEGAYKKIENFLKHRVSLAIVLLILFITNSCQENSLFAFFSYTGSFYGIVGHFYGHLVFFVIALHIFVKIMIMLFWIIDSKDILNGDEEDAKPKILALGKIKMWGIKMERRMKSRRKYIKSMRRLSRFKNLKRAKS